MVDDLVDKPHKKMKREQLKWEAKLRQLEQPRTTNRTKKIGELKSNTVSYEEQLKNNSLFDFQKEEE